MAKRQRLTRAQLRFLRALLNPSDSATALIVSPTAFGRWMASATFRAALSALRDSLRVQRDLHLSAAGVTSARLLRDV